MKRLLILLAVLGTGCASTKTSSDGEKVKVVHSESEVRACRYLGKVVVEGPVYTFIGGFVGAAVDRDIRRRNATALMGGDTLLRVGDDEDDAYLCKRLPAAKVWLSHVDPQGMPGCQFVRNINLDGTDAWIRATAVAAGANVIFKNLTNGNGEAYRCPDPKAAVKS